MDLIEQANKVYLENFSKETKFERCIFVTWYCSLGNCTFCYRSTQKAKIEDPRMAKRKMGSILAEALLCKCLDWNLDFITGGFGVYSTEELVEITKNISIIMEDKVWMNYGVFNEKMLEKLKPYVKGICSSIETVNEKVQKEVVPGKNIQVYLDQLKTKDFKKSLAIVIGIGETEEDIEKLHQIIKDYDIDRLTIFALHPIKGTPFTKGPELNYYLKWLAKTRIAFPKLEIVAGIPSDRAEEAGVALKAGANSITKYPAIKFFGSNKSQIVEEQIKSSGRVLLGSLTKIPEVNWDNEINKLPFDDKLKKEIKENLNNYLRLMKKEKTNSINVKEIE